jgi:VWFA-related protein
MKRNVPVLLAAIVLVGVLAISQQQPPQPPPAQPRLESVPKAKDPVQQPPAPAKPNDQDQQPFRIISNVNEVAMPVTFLDGTGDFVTNIERPEVTLTDNRIVQKITSFEIAYQPISMVILIDTSARMEGVLPNLRTSGILFTQLVMGETGEAAVLTYDQDVEIVQPFTANTDLVEKAFKHLKTGGSDAHLTDGVFRALGMLQNLKPDRRRVIVILAEGRDLGSETRKAQALREAQLANVAIYAVELSAFKAMAKRDLPGPKADPFPAGARPTEPGVPYGTQGGVVGFDMWPSIVEGARSVKALVWAHPLKTYSQGTGSDHINATNSHAVEDAVQKVGRELHSQYWLSYTPNNTRAQEYHTLEVKVNRPGVKARNRPGYMYIPPGSDTMADPGKLEKEKK